MKFFENETVKMEVRDGILISKHLSKEIISLEQAKEGIALKFKHIGDYPYPILADATMGKGATREAQEYVLRKDEEINTPAIAILVDSLVSRIFASVVVSFVKTDIKLKVFLDREKAIEWLKTFRKE